MQPLPILRLDMLIYTADQCDGSWLWLQLCRPWGARSHGVSVGSCCSFVLYLVFSIELMAFLKHDLKL